MPSTRSAARLVVLRTIPLKVLTLEEIKAPESFRDIVEVSRAVWSLGPAHRLRQVHHPGGHDRSPQRHPERAHPHHRGSHRVPAPGQPQHRSTSGRFEADYRGFSEALRAALRQDPDIILVGEMRDLETIETALHAAETGHMVFSTLHTLDATKTINRVISVFRPVTRSRSACSWPPSSRALISQRLVPRADGQGRVPAVEVMVATETVRSCIEDKDKTKGLKDVISAAGPPNLRHADLGPEPLFPAQAGPHHPRRRPVQGPEQGLLRLIVSLRPDRDPPGEQDLLPIPETPWTSTNCSSLWPKKRGPICSSLRSAPPASRSRPPATSAMRS